MQESGLTEIIPSARPSPLWATSLCSPVLSTLGPHQLAIRGGCGLRDTLGSLALTAGHRAPYRALSRCWAPACSMVGVPGPQPLPKLALGGGIGPACSCPWPAPHLAPVSRTRTSPRWLWASSFSQTSRPNLGIRTPPQSRTVPSVPGPP